MKIKKAPFFFRKEARFGAKNTKKNKNPFFADFLKFSLEKKRRHSYAYDIEKSFAFRVVSVQTSQVRIRHLQNPHT